MPILVRSEAWTPNSDGSKIKDCNILTIRGGTARKEGRLKEGKLGSLL
jgi:hypothetical protein